MPESLVTWLGEHWGEAGILAAAIFGLAYFVRLQKPNAELLGVMQARISELESRDDEKVRQIAEQAQALADLSSRNSELQTRLEIMESAHQNLPFPQWLKDNAGVMVSLNPSYEEIFLKPNGKTSRDYVGKDDFAVWPEDIALAFRKHDARVAAVRTPVLFYEEIVIGGARKTMLFLKYPRYVGNSVVGIAGMLIVRPEDPEALGQLGIDHLQ